MNAFGPGHKGAVVSLKKLFLTAALLCSSSNLMATENIYGIFSAGFSDTEFDLNSADGASYKLALGYQFHQQWYVEFGYQQLADESLLKTLPTTPEQAENFSPGMEGDALVLSFLGKASNKMGELFYRVGVVKADVKSHNLFAGNVGCELGAATSFALSGGEPYTLCEYDEGSVGGVIGLGFDFFVTSRAMLRAEVEHISGENNLSVNAAYVGFRYNF